MSDAGPAPVRDAADAAAVREAARAGDFERYLAALLAPAGARDDLLAVAAFCGEIARIPQTVREPMMGEIRLQWWRDTIQAAGRADRTGTPVADAVLDATRRRGLDADLLLGMLEARSLELYPEPLPDEATFHAALARTEGAAFALSARVLGAEPAAALDRLVQAAGHALGVTRALVGLPGALSRGRMPLPLPRIEATGTSIEDLAAGTTTPAVRRLVEGLRQEARSSLAEARALLPQLPRAPRTAFLPLALIEPHLRVLEGRGFDPLRQVAEIAPFSRVSRLWWAHATGRI